MLRRMRARLAAALVAAALVLPACAGGGDDDAGDTGAGRDEQCPVDALFTAATPVEIDFWYQAGGSTIEVVEELIGAFNASQDEVRVRGSLIPTYQEVFTKWRAGLRGGALPDVVQLEDTTVRQVVDSRATVPVAACVEASGYDLSDHLPRAIAFYTADGQLQALPWNVSNPVLFYDRNAFRRAGLDPDAPPRTLDEVNTASAQLVAKGGVSHGIALKVLPYYVEFWRAKAGRTVVDHDNGREGRATAATIDDATSRVIWRWWDEMVDAGLALDVGTTPGPDHLLAVGNRQAAMTIEASTAIGPVFDVLSTGQFAGLEMGVGPLPGVEDGGGVPVGDGSLWIAARSSAAERAAAWRFMTWLNEPAQQATLHVRAGTVPIRRTTLDDARVKALWAERPLFRVAYDQLQSGPATAATSGPLIGDYQGVRDAIVSSLVAMLTGDLTPDEAVRRAQRDADAAIAAYEERVTR